MLRCLHSARSNMTTIPATRPRTRLRHWTYARYRRIPDDRNTHEILDGKHFARPSPSIRHQEVASGLMCELAQLLHDANRGTVLACRCDLHLAPCTVVHPDLVVMLRRNLSIVGKQKITGVPDLIVEVLSPGAYDPPVVVGGRVQLHVLRGAEIDLRKVW